MVHVRNAERHGSEIIKKETMSVLSSTIASTGKVYMLVYILLLIPQTVRYTWANLENVYADWQTTKSAYEEVHMKTSYCRKTMLKIAPHSNIKL